MSLFPTAELSERMLQRNYFSEVKTAFEKLRTIWTNMRMKTVSLGLYVCAYSTAGHYRQLNNGGKMVLQWFSIWAALHLYVVAVYYHQGAVAQTLSPACLCCC